MKETIAKMNEDMARQENGLCLSIVAKKKF